MILIKYKLYKKAPAEHFDGRFCVPKKISFG